MKIISINYTIFLLIALSIHQIYSYPTFQQYTHDFNKTYSSLDQQTQRQNIYNQRITSFADITDYVPGVNNFTDWTDQEIKKIKNYQPIIINSQTNYITDESSSNSPYVSVSAPQSLDWRTSKVITSIKSQGQCGACWAFGVAAYVQSKLIIQRGYNQTVDLSEQYLVSCTSGSSCSGGYPQDAMQVVAKGGIPFESSYPYNPYGSVSAAICSTSNKITEAGNKFRKIDNATDQQMISLLQTGPLTVSISAQKWQNYYSGVFVCPSGAVIDHVVLLVGYTSDYWIVKNQWAKSWGQSGYMRLTRSRNNTYTNCLIGAITTYMDPNPLQLVSSFSSRITSFLLLGFFVLGSLIF